MGSILRTRFENYMTLRDFSPSTKVAYMNAVEGLVRYYHQSPDELGNDQIQDYLVHLMEKRKLSWNSCNVVISGLRCFYTHVLRRDETGFHIPPRPRRRELPPVLSAEEVKKLINAAENPKHRILLKAVYGCGFRVSEAVRLRPEHIESDRMLIRIEQGKGKKDRYTVLPESLLRELRIYWKNFRPEFWVFFGRDRSAPMPVGTAQKIFYHAKRKSGISRARGIHTLRHCFATHLLDKGMDIYTIKEMMGHASLKTTIGYLHVTKERIGSIKSPLDNLYE